MQTNYRVIKESKMNRNIYFQLVSGNFKNKYAIQYIKRLKIKDKLISRESYETKARADSVYKSLVKLNNYRKKYN